MASIPSDGLATVPQLLSGLARYEASVYFNYLSHVDLAHRYNGQMEFILPTLLLLITVPLFALLGTLMGRAITENTWLFSKLSQTSLAENAKTAISTLAILTATAIAIAGPTIVFIFPFVAHDAYQKEQWRLEASKVNNFIDYFASVEKELFEAISADDKVVKELQVKLDSLGELEYQLGPRHGEVRELAFSNSTRPDRLKRHYLKLNRGENTVGAEAIVDAAVKKKMKRWIIGEAFQPPDLHASVGISGPNGYVEADPANVLFIARRNAADDGVDVDIYTDYAVPRDLSYAIQPVDGYLSKYLGHYLKQCVLDKVHIMPMKKLPAHAKGATIDKIYGGVYRLLNADEKAVLNDKFTNKSCVEYVSRTLEKINSPFGIEMFQHRDVRNPWVKLRHDGILHTVEIDPDCPIPKERHE